jgi:two-component system, cell cycle sensor histidine kinase and response regulator CckA
MSEAAGRGQRPGSTARAGRHGLARPELWIPLSYAVAAGAWIALSDRLLELVATSQAQQATWSIVKGMGFVAATTALLYFGVRRAMVREREAWERLAERDAQLRAVAEAVPDPVFVKDRESRWIFANQATLEVVGRPAAEVLGRTDLEIYRDPAIGQALMAVDRRVIDSGHAEVLEERVETPAGLRLFLSAKAPYRGTDGAIIGVIGSSRDITGRKEGEARLAAERERLAVTLRSIGEAVLATDELGRVSLLNAAAEELTGWTAAEAVGRPLHEVLQALDDRSRRPIPDVEGRARRGEGAESLPHRAVVVARDGRERLAAWSAAPIREPGGRSCGAVLVIRDLTAQRRLEEQVNQSQKLESIGRLAGGVAHDFNNLLTVILSGADGLREDLRAGQPPRIDDVEEIYAAGRRASELTRQLLAFSRKQAIAPVVVDLNAALAGTEKLLRRVLGEDVELLVQPQPGLWPILCDPGQVEQVIMNLAVNARHAMPQGGTLRLETRNLPPGLGPSADGVERPGEWVALAVRDSGVGMTAEVRAHLFEPFFTTKEAGKGTGLGLATVYGILRQSGGHVQVESEPGKGACFELFFPRHRGEVAASAPTARPAAPGGNETVLVIEDDPLVREVTVRALRGSGYRVLVAGGGAEALALVEQSDAPQLVVTDVILPGLDGRAVVEELRRRHGGLRVLFVSGYTADVIEHHGVRADGVGFLSKPFTPASLLAEVRAALDSRPDRVT